MFNCYMKLIIAILRENKNFRKNIKYFKYYIIGIFREIIKFLEKINYNPKSILNFKLKYFIISLKIAINIILFIINLFKN